MKLNNYLFFLLIFIFIDISNDLKILIDDFTFISLYFTLIYNPLSIFLILTFPYLQKRLNR